MVPQFGGYVGGPQFTMLNGMHGGHLKWCPRCSDSSFLKSSISFLVILSERRSDPNQDPNAPELWSCVTLVVYSCGSRYMPLRQRIAGFNAAHVMNFQGWKFFPKLPAAQACLDPVSSLHRWCTCARPFHLRGLIGQLSYYKLPEYECKASKSIAFAT